MSARRAALGSALLLAAAASAQDYRRTQVPGKDPGNEVCLAWGVRELSYYVHSAGSAKTPGETEFIAIDASFQTWQALSDSCSDFRFLQGSRIADPVVGKTTGSASNNVVLFRETNCRDVVPSSDTCLSDGSCGNKYRCWDHSDTTIALTTTTFSFRSGQIFDADIELNASPHADGEGYLFTAVSSPPCEEGSVAAQCVATDIQNTLTHEIGHMLGFDHVDVLGSTMEPSAPLGEVTKRIIDPGTAQGFCDTYPRGLQPLPCSELAQLQRKIVARNTGTAGLESACSASGGGPAIVLLALGFFSLSRGVRGTRTRRPS